MRLLEQVAHRREVRPGALRDLMEADFAPRITEPYEAFATASRRAWRRALG